MAAPKMTQEDYQRRYGIELGSYIHMHRRDDGSGNPDGNLPWVRWRNYLLRQGYRACAPRAGELRELFAACAAYTFAWPILARRDEGIDSWALSNCIWIDAGGKPHPKGTIRMSLPPRYLPTPENFRKYGKIIPERPL